MSRNNRDNRPAQFIRRGFRFAVFLHVAFLVWITGSWAVEKFLYHLDRQKLKQPKMAIRVDMVALPSLKLNELYKVDLTKEAAPAAKLPEKPKEAPPPPPPSEKSLKLPEKLGGKKSTLNGEQKQRLQEIQDSYRAEAKRQELLSKYQKEAGKDEKRPLLGGNIISKGGSVKGDVANESDEFIALIHTHVQKFWRAPPWAEGQNYKALVTVKLSPTGRVLSKQVVKSSGRPEFDASALEAVSAADPFPAPPLFLKRVVLEEGIQCGFPE